MSWAPPAAPVLGPDGQRCPQCGELLRADQRYCLNCGRRRAEMRLPFHEIVGPHGLAAAAVPTGAAPVAVGGPGSLAAASPHAAAPPVAGHPALAARALERSPLVALGLLLALLLALGIGVLIGRGARGPEVVARAPVVNVAAAPASGATTTAPVVTEWPTGKDGWTIQLNTLPSTATADEAAKAKQDATTVGATAVGVLRSDEFPSLTPAQIVIYSGTYDKKADATKALPALTASFPGATVVHVSASAPAAASTPTTTDATPATPKKKTSNLSPDEFQKKSKKLPDEVQSEGTAPPKDNKAPGGGNGETTTIG